MKKLLFLSILTGVLLTFSGVEAGFLDNNFWAGSPTDNQIETALFATDSSYTQNRTGYSTACSISSVVHLSAGTDVLPQTGASNTIYVLDAGTYITTYQINLSDCSAIVGNGEVVMQSTGQLTRLLFGSGVSNIILDNFQIDGKTLHTATPNSYGLEILGNSKNITFNKLDVYGTAYGIVLRNIQYMDIYSTKSHDNSVDGFYLIYMYKTNLYNCEAYGNMGTNNNNDGGIFLFLSSGVLVKDMVTHHNRQLGLATNNFNDSIIDGLISYSNTGHGMKYTSSQRNIMTNSQFYNNYFGIYSYASTGNIIQNCNIFNNIAGLTVGAYSNNSFSNLNIFNNTQGINSWSDTNDIFDNINLFNNNYGIWIEDSLDNNYLNNIRSYNNLTGINFDYYWNITVNLPSLGNKYYGKLSLFNNQYSNIGGINSYISTGLIVSGGTYDGVAFLVAGSDGYLSNLGRTSGTIDSSPTFDSSWLIEPINASGISLFAGMPANKIGQNLSWQASSNINYIYGKSIAKQTAPLVYSGTSFVLANLEWNPYTYVGKTWDLDQYFFDKDFVAGTGISKFAINPNTMIGNSSIDIGAFTGSILPKQIIFQSTGVNKAEVIINNGINLLNADGITNYTGSFTAPSLVSPDLANEIKYKTILSVVRIGAGNQIQLSGGSATITIPVLGSNLGEVVDIYYSNDDTIWTKLTSLPVIDLGGTPYVQFQTTHFTDFAVAQFTGTFVINNDNFSTLTQNVTLDITMPIAISGMRFSNTSGSNRTTRESYSTTKSRALSTGNGSKTVYAEFDVDGDTIGDIFTSDNINFNGPVEGQISLEILSGTSQCIYGTSLSLGNQDVKFQTGYTFTGDFGSGERSCTDYKAGAETRTFTIQSSSLSNGKGNSISATGIEINHSAGTRTGDPKCTAGYASGSNWAVINTPYTIMERGLSGQQTCKVTIPMVNLKIGVGANQAPGTYSGTLTLTLQGI